MATDRKLVLNEFLDPSFDEMGEYQAVLGESLDRFVSACLGWDGKPKSQEAALEKCKVIRALVLMAQRGTIQDFADSEIADTAKEWDLYRYAKNAKAAKAGKYVPASQVLDAPERPNLKHDRTVRAGDPLDRE